MKAGSNLRARALSTHVRASRECLNNVSEMESLARRAKRMLRQGANPASLITLLLRLSVLGDQLGCNLRVVVELTDVLAIKEKP